MLPVVAGALSPDGQFKLKQWQTQMVPCSRGSINGTKTILMRDTGSTTCVVKKSLVKPEQMTGSYELCMLIDGIVKRYPTAMVELDTPYFSGKTKVLCMDNPVQDIIIGNIPGASGVHPNLVNTKATVTPKKVDSTQSLYCQNVSKGTVSKEPLGKLPLVETPFSVICVDIVGPISRPSEGFQYILTTIDMCTRFSEAVPLKDISTSTVAEALLNMFSKVGLPHRINFPTVV